MSWHKIVGHFATNLSIIATLSYLEKFLCSTQGSFSKKRTVETPSSSAENARRGGGAMPPPQNFFQFWILNRRILVQTEFFLYSSPKAGLNAVPTVKITVGTPFPGVHAGNEPWFNCRPT